MYRAIAHRRRLLNGYSGYWPAGFSERAKLASRLPDAAALAQLRAATGLGLVMVRLADFGLEKRRLCALAEGVVDEAARRDVCDRAIFDAEVRRWVALADRGGRDDLRFVTRVDDVLVFAVGEATPMPPAPADRGE
jgi:hypothetical protein